jgi:hypothetical protein
VVNEHAVHSALVAVEEPDRLVPVSHLDLHAFAVAGIRAEKGSYDGVCDCDLNLVSVAVPRTRRWCPRRPCTGRSGERRP